MNNQRTTSFPFHAVRNALYRGVGVAAVAMMLAGCQVNPKPDYDRAKQLIRESTSLEAAQDPEDQGPAQDDLNQQLADGLGLDEALRRTRSCRSTSLRISGSPRIGRPCLGHR